MTEFLRNNYKTGGMSRTNFIQMGPLTMVLRSENQNSFIPLYNYCHTLVYYVIQYILMKFVFYNITKYIDLDSE